MALLLALVLMAPTAALAATTTGYNQTPPPPTTTGYKQTPPAPKTETTPAKQEVGPKQEETTRRTTTTTMTATSPSHEAAPTVARPSAARPRATTLPFTGLDLRWVVFGGALLLGSGLSLMLALRRRDSAGR